MFDEKTDLVTWHVTSLVKNFVSGDHNDEYASLLINNDIIVNFRFKLYGKSLCHC